MQANDTLNSSKKGPLKPVFSYISSITIANKLQWMRKKFAYLTLFAGAEPYPGISPYKLPSVLQKGYRIPKPKYFKDELYVLSTFYLTLR